MTITVTSPASGAKLGPGVTVKLHTDFTGALAVDDYFVAEILKSGVSDYYVIGTRRCFGTHDGIVTLGKDPVGAGFVTCQWFADFNPGDAVTLSCWMNHANGTTFDFGSSITGFVWEPVQAAYVLLGGLGQEATDVTAIKNAVLHTFPATT